MSVMCELKHVLLLKDYCLNDLSVKCCSSSGLEADSKTIN